MFKDNTKKIIRLKQLLPEFTNQELAYELDINISTIKRALKQ